MSHQTPRMPTVRDLYPLGQEPYRMSARASWTLVAIVSAIMAIVAMAITLMGVSKAHATDVGDMSGRELVAACQARRPVCYTFMNTFTTGMLASTMLLGKDGCWPNNSVQADVAMVVKYFVQHPEKRQQSAPLLITNAFASSCGIPDEFVED